MIRTHVTVLVSRGRHPRSGRIRRADADARATELALRIPEAKVRIVYAGPRNENLVREYCGMGVPTVDHLIVEEGSDPTPALVKHVSSFHSSVILAGTRAECGRGSGWLPYAVAHELGIPLLPHIAYLRLDEQGIIADQALPGGRRRRLRSSSPCVATICAAAPDPRLVTLAKARRGKVQWFPVRSEPDEWELETPKEPARARPRRIHPTRISGSAEERLEAAIGAPSNSGEVLTGLGPDAAADAIIEFLRGEQIL